MKPHAIGGFPTDSPGKTPIFAFVRKLCRVFHHAAIVIGIPVLVLVMVIGAYRTIMTPRIESLIQASLPTTGFVFLALAIDSGKASARWLLAATGLALPLLAQLSTGGAQEFTIMAAILLALWISNAILSR